MQSRCFVLLGSAGLMLLFQTATAASGVSLLAMEEPVSTLVSPSAATIPSMQYTYAGAAFVATTVTSTPLLCANTGQPSVAGTTLNPVYYSAFGGVGNPNPRPFVFGASAGSPGVSAQAQGATQVAMTASSMQFLGDASGSLVCYGLDPHGAHRLTRDMFEDGVDPNPYNSSVSLSVTHVPSSPTDFYAYRIDVTLPALPSSTDDFALIEGFDTSVFATVASEATSGLQGFWCQSLDGQTCAQILGNSYVGNINFSYSNGINNSLQAPVAPSPDVTYHLLVKRYLRTGVTSLPTTGAPVAIVALFSPNDLQENKLDDNVASGNNEVANAAPSVTQDATFTSFSGSLAALNENTDSGTLTFDIADTDTPDPVSGPHLTAAVTLNVAGLSFPAAADCSTVLAPGSGVAASRACTVDIPLNNANAWNAAVASNYDGLFNALATDTTNGSYASGVTASAQIVVTDAGLKSSAPVSVPIHIHSTVNNAPLIAYAGQLVATNDPNNNQSYPTYSCSVSAGSGVGGCGAPLRGSIDVTLTGSVTATPGPAAAFDELVTQTTAVVPFKDANDSFTNVQCDREQTALVFVTNGGPIVAAAGVQGTYDMDFLLPTTPPASAVSALCTLTITDVGPFPNGETAKTTSKQFRIVVNP